MDIELNEYQKAVVEHFNGPCLVTAVPGSGKTATITERVKKKELNENFPFGTDIEKHIIFIKEELNKDSIENFWQIKDSVFLSCYMDNQNELEKNIDNLKKILE